MTVPAPGGTAPARPAPARPAHRRPVLIALMVTMALSAMDNTIVSTAIPQVVRDLGGFTEFSWVFSGYLLTQTVSIPVYGKLADLWGRKPVLIAGTIIFLTGSALCAAAWSMVSLICFRALQGLGAGSIMATVNTLAGDLYDLPERGRVQGWLSSVWGISAVFGPTLGGSLAQYVSWRWIFVINLPLGTVALLLIGRFLHEQVTRTRHRIDVAGAVAVLVAAGALVFGLLQGGTAWPWWSVPSVAVFAVAAAAGGVLATMSVGWPLSTSQSARFYLRLGFRDTELIGAAVCLAGIVFFLLTTGSWQVWQPVVSTFVLGFGLGLISVCTLVGPQSTVTWGQRGVVTGTVMFCRYLGQSVGAAIFGAVFNAALRARLHAAPPGLRGRIPVNVSQAGPALTRPGILGQAAAHYLRAAIAAGTHDVYLGLAVSAVATLFTVLAIVPRRFATQAGGTASTGPAGGTGGTGPAGGTGGTGSASAAGPPPPRPARKPG